MGLTVEVGGHLILNVACVPWLLPIHSSPYHHIVDPQFGLLPPGSHRGDLEDCGRV